MPSYGDDSSRYNEGTCYDSCDEEDYWLGLTGEEPQRDVQREEAVSLDGCHMCGCAVQSYQLVPCAQETTLCEDCAQVMEDEACRQTNCQCPICTQTKTNLVLRMVAKP